MAEDILPPCPECSSKFTYLMGEFMVCPECGFEWTQAELDAENTVYVIRDANGNSLSDGDSVIVIKNLPVKGAPTPIKAGTKVKNIRLIDGDHNIETRINGFGTVFLKSALVKKA